MEAILTTFGIDWRLLLINVINFGVLLFALWYFLYAPVMAMLEERRTKVAAGVAAAAAAQEELKQTGVQRAKVLSAAGAEADQLLSVARAAAAAKEAEALSAAGRVAAQTVKDAEARAAELKAQAIEESKKEVAKLIVLGMEKVLKK